MSQEIFSYLFDIFFERGALDIYISNIYMKKNRPASKISVLCHKEDKDKFIKILLTETSTFGVRYNKLNREVLFRKYKKIDTIFGHITVKLGYYKGQLIKATCEYDECKLIAKREGLPIIKVYEEINFIIKNKINSNMLT